MADNHLLIETIKLKIQKIVERNKELAIENLKLKDKQKDFEHTLNLQRETIRDLEEKNKLLKIAGSIQSNNEDKKALKLKINAFIREIDKTMSLLND